jgi:thiamine biosynthesis lipoprotein
MDNSPGSGDLGASVFYDGGLRRVELVMGTMVALDLAERLPEDRLTELADDFFAWMREVDQRFSVHRADSEVSRLGRGEIRAEDCSRQLRDVLDACADLWNTTNGFFDIYATGKLDPSGYVKGWAAEVASARLAAAGSVNHCVNAGGDVRTRGNPAPGALWHIPVTHPWQTDGAFLMIAGTDLGIATSGTYRRGFHVLQPFTGVAASALRSVTIVGPDLAVADAYATATVAMGEAGLEWLATLPKGYHSAVVTEDGRGFTSPGLPSVHPLTPAPAQRPAGPAHPSIGGN